MTHWIIAHRGGAYEAPENTFSAFDKTLAVSADGIETDVQMTKDGVPVLYHDKTLHKLCGIRSRISDLSFEELIKLKLRNWYKMLSADERMPTLSDFLDRYIGKTRLLLEIKSEKRDKESGWSYQIADAVLHLLTKPEPVRHRDMIYILCFDPDVLQYAAQKEPSFQYVLNLSYHQEEPTSASGILNCSDTDLSYLCGICVKEKFLSKTLSEFVYDRKKILLTYSINTLRQLKHTAAFHADMLITDRPEWLKAKADLK